MATFQAQPLQAGDFATRIEAGELFLVAEVGGTVVAAAWVTAYDPAHEYYDGVGEATLYVERSGRRRGIGGALLEALSVDAARRGRHKLVAKIFTSNEPSIALFRACGFREVGVHIRHGRLAGEWKDVLVMERLLGMN